MNLEILVLVQSLKSSNVELGWYLDERLSKYCLSVAANPQSRLDLIGFWLCVDAELAIGHCRLGVHGTCGATCGRCHNCVGIPGRPPYVIPRGSAG